MVPRARSIDIHFVATPIPSAKLFTIQQWVLDRQIKSVPGVADVNSFGGEELSYEISVNPNYLTKYGLSLPLMCTMPLRKAM
jgi:Cu/Ag efflux pump CusA